MATLCKVCKQDSGETEVCSSCQAKASEIMAGYIFACDNCGRTPATQEVDGHNICEECAEALREERVREENLRYERECS